VRNTNPRSYLLTFMLAFIVGCAQLGLKTETFQEKDLVAITMVNAIEKSAIANLKADLITVADAENVVKGRNVAMDGLQIARGMYVTNPQGANLKVTAVIASLTILNQYLVDAATKKASRP
jgi:hypothetical protein